MKTGNYPLGYTLIEMALVLMIVGVMTGVAFKYMNGMADEKALEVTLQRQQKVARALSNYVLTNGVLPCPTVPGTVPEGSPRATCTTIADRSGTVPFRVLGLTLKDTMDGYGSLLTYSVSEAATNLRSNKVHDNCRLDTVWIKSAVAVNAAKAIFCCQEKLAGDLEVYSDTTGTLVIPAQTGGASFGVYDSPVPAKASYNSAFIAYVLVSHGKNRDNAYTPGSTTRPGASANIGTYEAENAADLNEFYDLPISTKSGSDYFDDIVLWRTQEMVFSELHNDSCFYP